MITNNGKNINNDNNNNNNMHMFNSDNSMNIIKITDGIYNVNTINCIKVVIRSGRREEPEGPRVLRAALPVWRRPASPCYYHFHYHLCMYYYCLRDRRCSLPAATGCIGVGVVAVASSLMSVCCTINILRKRSLPGGRPRAPASLARPSRRGSQNVADCYFNVECKNLAKC